MRLIFMDAQITDLPKHEDERGFLVEFLKGTELSGAHPAFGTLYLTTIQPGGQRGHHYHEHLWEYFTVMAGRIRLTLESVPSRERLEVILDANDRPLKRVRFGPYTAHVLENIADTVAVVVSYATEIYQKDHVDQVPYRVITR